jgi:hypothetical protein
LALRLIVFVGPSFNTDDGLFSAGIMTQRQLLLAEVGGPEGLARLTAICTKASPRRSRWGPGILTADEVFRDNARREGFSEKGITMFLDQVGFWSNT